MEFDTIAAISTPPGEGGIGIVRVSGPLAIAVAEKIVRLHSGRALARASNRRMAYGHVVDGQTGQVVDEVLVNVMRGPRTYTCEDVVEINCHGGIVPLRRVLALVLENGARSAEAGEFTKRAFLNGRLDLAQAEAVIDLIRAQTEAGADLALRQLDGQLSKRVKTLRRDILALLAHAEATIDFPEEIGDVDDEEATRRVRELQGALRDLRAGAEQGKIYRQGLKTVIIGRPNVGKSSLLNVLLGEERAIVTAVPGTTRDLLEEVISIRGIPLRLVDTAGLRVAKDEVEMIGVQRSRASLNTAELVLWVLDGSEGLQDEDRTIAEAIGSRPTVIVVNKGDRRAELDRVELQALRPKDPLVVVSALAEQGIEELQDVIFELVMGGKAINRDQMLITKARHQEAVTRALRHLEEAETTLSVGMPIDCLAIDLRAAWEALGEISGETAGTDLLDEIFGNFCVGK